jgi:hypothetical protein
VASAYDFYTTCHTNKEVPRAPLTFVRGLGETRTAVGSHPLEKEPHGGGPGLPRDSLILGTPMSPSPGLHGWRPYSFP